MAGMARAGRAHGRLHERDAELRMAADLLDRASADHRGGTLFFVAGAGLGKTALLRQVSRDATGFRIGQAAGDPAETSVAFSFLGSALDALGCPVPLVQSGAGGRDERSARFHRVLQWLREVRTPTLFAFDDLQWADSDSVAMLSFLCRRLDGLPVAVIATMRSWPAAGYDVARRLWAAGRASVAELAQLSDRAAEQMIMDRLPGQASGPVSKRAVAMCAGNPLLLEQVATRIAEGDAPDAQGRSAELLSRFMALPAGTVRCAQAASILGPRFRPSLAAKMVRVPEKTIENALDALARSGLVREASDHTVEFVHPLLRQLLYEDLGAAVRDRLHRRACRSLLDQGLDREAARHAMLGHVTDDPAAIAVLERVGLDALGQGAVGSAAEHLRAAVTLAGRRASRMALIGLSEALLAGGHYQEAIARGERLAAMPPGSRHELARTLIIRATGLTQAARLEEACECLDGIGGEQDARTEQGYCRWRLNGPAAALPILAQAREPTDPRPDPWPDRPVDRPVDPAADPPADARPGPGRARVAALRGLVALQAGDPSGFGEVAAASRPVVAAPWDHLSDFTTRWGALASFAVSALLTERFTHSEQAYAAALEAADQSGAGRTTGVLGLRIGYAELLLRSGRLGRALSLTSEVLDLSGLVPALAPAAGLTHAEILLHLDRLDEAGEWLSRVEAGLVAGAGWEPALRLCGIKGQRALRAGEWHTASTHFLRAEELSAQAGVGEPCLSMWARHAIAAHLRAGRTADAERVLGWLDRCAARLPCRWPRLAALSARAGLAELAGDPRTAEAAFTEAIALQADLDLPLERIETLLEYGTFLRRIGGRARARPPLAQALSIAESISANWLVKQAHRELTASGGRRRRQDTASRLTPRERRVSDLAAQGLTNDAIASLLRVSAGTVKTHLEHIYAKLGIHSRRELMLHRPDLGR